MDGGGYTRFTVAEVNFKDGYLTAEFDTDVAAHDPITVSHGIDYLLVPAEDVDRAFCSLQDAGIAAGVEPGRNTIKYLERMRAYVAELEGAVGEAMTVFREYQAMHAAKANAEGVLKAKANRDMARRMEEALDDKSQWGF
jgi:hypothetical protein